MPTISDQPDQSRAAGHVPAAAWWRFPLVWMVWGGPAVVVVASFVTLYIAVKFGDKPLAPATEAAHEQVAGHNTPMTPALQARNHVATQSLRDAAH